MVLPHSLMAFLMSSAGPIESCFTGGTLTTAPNLEPMRYFDTSGTAYFTNNCGSDVNVAIVIVAGGGGGGKGNSGAGDPKCGGGGGAGGRILVTSATIKSGEVIPVEVGAASTGDANGGDSIVWLSATGTALNPAVDTPLAAYKAIGGGYGGSGGGDGQAGGSGGGGGSGSDITVGGGVGGLGTSGQGTAGGDGVGYGGGVSCHEGAGGGGGSSAGVGKDGTPGTPPEGGQGGPMSRLVNWGFNLGSGGVGAAILDRPPGNCSTGQWMGQKGDGFGFGGGGGIDNSGYTGGGSGIIAFQITGVANTTEWPDATIARTTEGLEFRDQFTTSDGNLNGYNGWTEQTAGKFQIASNEVTTNWTPGDYMACQNLGDLGSEVIAQVNIKRDTEGSGGGEIMMNMDSIGDPTDAGSSGFSVSLGPAWSKYNFNIWPGGEVSNNTNYAAYGSWESLRITYEEWYSTRRLVKGYRATGLSSGTDLSNDVSEVISRFYDGGSYPTGAYYGIRDWNGDMHWDEFFICGRHIFVEDLPAGWSVQIDSRTAKTGTGGILQFDPALWALPATSIKIYDPDSTLIDTLTPSSGIWGGDVFTVTTEGGP